MACWDCSHLDASEWGEDRRDHRPSINPQAAAVGIVRAVGTVGTARPEGIIDGLLGERRAVAVYLVYLV